MEEIGDAVETFCRTGGTSRKAVWGQRFKSLLIKRVLPLKGLNDLGLIRASPHGFPALGGISQ